MPIEAPFTEIDFQYVYQSSRAPLIIVDALRGGLIVRDNVAPIGADLFQVQNNAGGLLFGVDVAEVTSGVNVNVSRAAPRITFTDSGGDDYIIAKSGNNLLVDNITSNITGLIDLDHIIRLRQNPRMPVPNFTSEYAMIHNATVNVSGGAVQGYFVLDDQPNVTIGGAYDSYGIVNAHGTCTCTSVSNLDAIYLFVNVMNSTATFGNNPAIIHSFDSKPRTYAATGQVLGSCLEVAALNDWANLESVGTGQASINRWITVRATAFDPFYYRLVTSAAGGSVTVANRIGFEMGPMTKSGGGGTETIQRYYGLLFYPFNNASILACGAWIGKQVNAASNYGIVLDGDGIGAELRLGDGQDSAVYYDGTDMILDPDIVGTGRVLIGTTGNNNMLLNNIEIDGNLDHDGAGVGFYGTAPVAKPTIVGAKGGNVALANLLTALAGMGLLTDNTT